MHCQYMRTLNCNSSRATPSFHRPVFEAIRPIMMKSTSSMPYGTNIGGIGIMGSGKLREWFVGKIALIRHVTNEKVPHKTSSQRRIYIPAKDGIYGIPPFQYSMCEEKAQTSQRLLLFSISCEIPR